MLSIAQYLIVYCQQNCVSTQPLATLVTLQWYSQHCAHSKLFSAYSIESLLSFVLSNMSLKTLILRGLFILSPVLSQSSGACSSFVYNRATSCSNNLAASTFPTCRTVNITFERGFCEVQTIEDLKILQSVARVLGRQAVCIQNKDAIPIVFNYHLYQYPCCSTLMLNLQGSGVSTPPCGKATWLGLLLAIISTVIIYEKLLVMKNRITFILISFVLYTLTLGYDEEWLWGSIQNAIEKRNGSICHPFQQGYCRLSVPAKETAHVSIAWPLSEIKWYSIAWVMVWLTKQIKIHTAAGVQKKLSNE